MNHRSSTGDLVTVRWPVSGRILKLVKESEGVVQAGDPLIELGNTRALEVEVEVLSVDAVKMAPGTAVEFTRWGGEKPLEGRVRVLRRRMSSSAMTQHERRRARRPSQPLECLHAAPATSPASSAAMLRATRRASSSALLGNEMPPTTGWPPPP